MNKIYELLGRYENDKKWFPIFEGTKTDCEIEMCWYLQNRPDHFTEFKIVESDDME